MEEKKFDPYQFIGFILIAVILTWMLYRNGPAEEASTAKATTEEGATVQSTPEVVQVSDSILQQQKVEAFGDLGTLFVPKPTENVKITTDNFSVEVQSKGGQIVLFQLDEFENYEDAPIRLIDESNTDFNIVMTTLDGRLMNTREMYFSPTLTDKGDAYHLVDGSTICLDSGYHPCAVLPGYQMYYFTILGGLSQRSLVQYFQPSHADQLETIPGIKDMIAKFK